MAKKFEVELMAEFSVEFADPEKSHAYFVEGDWKKCFWSVSDLEELAGQIAIFFHHASAGCFSSKVYLEGFGDFISNGTDQWISTTDATAEYGQIIVHKTGDLDVLCCNELDEEQTA